MPDAINTSGLTRKSSGVNTGGLRSKQTEGQRQRAMLNEPWQGDRNPTAADVGSTVGGVFGGPVGGIGMGMAGKGLDRLYDMVAKKPDAPKSVGEYVSDVALEGGKQGLYQGLGGVGAKGFGAVAKYAPSALQAGGAALLKRSAKKDSVDAAMATAGLLGSLTTGGLSLPLALQHPLVQKMMGKGAQAAGRAVGKLPKKPRADKYAALARMLGLTLDEDEEEDED